MSHQAKFFIIDVIFFMGFNVVCQWIFHIEPWQVWVLDGMVIVAVTISYIDGATRWDKS